MLTACFTAAATVLLHGATTKASGAVVERASSQDSGAPPVERDALRICDALASPKSWWADRYTTDAQLQKPDDRIEGRDYSGQDLSGQSFRGKVLVHVNLKGTRLRRADLSDAIICNSDLTDADLTGARLNRALIGGATELQGANFTDASARSLQIADVSGESRVDGADLRGARISCDFVNTGGFCIWRDMAFISMLRADLRGATVDHLGSPPGLASARLDGITIRLDFDGRPDFVQLAAGVGNAGRLTFVPNEFYSGHPTEFTGGELRQLPAALRRMHSASARPSFDCARARTVVEKAICADPKLAALDRAVAWLWRRVEHTPQQKAVQARWLRGRAHCPPPVDDLPDTLVPRAIDSFISAADPHGCIGLAYAERIAELAPRASPAALQGGTYTSDPPLELPRGRYSTLAEKFLTARGFRMDEINVKSAGTHAAEISGSGVWSNGHMCGFVTEGQAERVGAQFRVTDDPAAPRDNRYSLSLAITPQVIIRVGGANQFQCGARGGWSDAYYRQPDRLISAVVNLQDPF